MKKIICLCMCMLLVVLATGCGCGKKEIGSTGSKDVDKNSIYVSDAKGSKGDEVIVYISASDKTPVAAYTMTLSFDETKLEMVEYGISDKFEDKYHGMNLSSDAAGMITYAGANATESETMYQGEMFYAKFKIVSEEKGDAELALNLDILTAFDETGHEDEFTAVNGKITIE